MGRAFPAGFASSGLNGSKNNFFFYLLSNIKKIIFKWLIFLDELWLKIPLVYPKHRSQWIHSIFPGIFLSTAPKPSNIWWMNHERSPPDNPSQILGVSAPVIPLLLQQKAGKGILNSFSHVHRKQDGIWEFFHPFLLQAMPGFDLNSVGVGIGF